MTLVRSCVKVNLLNWNGNTFHWLMCYSTQAIIKKSQKREKLLLQKMIRGSFQKKRPWYELRDIKNVSLPMPKLPFLSAGCNSRRMSMLNKVFMRHITDLMASGEVAADIVGRGLQISRVKISIDFKNLSVYWLSQNPKDDAEIERILARCAGHLRHELSQLQVVGTVPRIEFVKDRQFTKLVDVDHLLVDADYGEDYTPVNAHYYHNANFTQNANISHTSSDDKPLPPMRMDVLGLDRALIMNKVQKALRKAQAQHRKEHNVLEMEPGKIDADVASPSIKGSQIDKLDLSKFLIQKQAAREKVMKKTRSAKPELELFDVEQSDNEKYLESFLSEIDDKDFMIDDDENNT